MKAQYPKCFVDGDHFELQKDFNQGSSYEEDLQKAKQYAKKVKGKIYTQIDTGRNSAEYQRGIHFVNRLGYSVVKLPKRMRA